MAVGIKDTTLCLSRGVVADGTLTIENYGSNTFYYEDDAIVITGRVYFMARLERFKNMYFASFDGTTWEVLGRDNEDLSKDLNPDIESGKNVIGEATFKHSGYEPEINTDPYYADPDTALYEKLKAAAVQELYGDTDIKGYFVEVVFDGVQSSTAQLTGTGYKREAYIVPQSTGGDTSGFSIPFTINPTGPMTEVDVTYTRATRAVTITNHT